ncbi:ABC transporter permease subunit [Mesorhizobium sp. M0047]|uniref:ABC transporter permease subunit n=1 Tax=Mesorhizobium sp. M0047 TaxID=2956859 RepID=UPI0033373E61
MAADVPARIGGSTAAQDTPLMRMPVGKTAFVFNIIRMPDATGAARVDRMLSQNRSIYERIRKTGGALYPPSALPMSRGDWRLCSMRGFVVPAVGIDVGMTGLLMILCAIALAIAGRIAVRKGWSPKAVVPGVLAVSAAGVWLADARFTIDWPVFTGSNFEGGKELTPELSTILIGLTLYTTGFVAEIVRGGVLSIGRGQWDARHSLGLPRGKILRLIVIPQMLRVIVPPLNSQYINVVKNSTLAIAVGYPDFLAEVLDTMASLAGDGMTMLCVTHEMGFARQVAERVVFMDQGEIVETNTPVEFFTNPLHERSKLFLSQILN